MDQKSRTNIAIIGAGIFGVTTALLLESKGYDVHIYEKEKDIFEAATGINQYRIHRGYHYPRSFETISSSLISETSFRDWYQGSILDHFEHNYAIAKEGSKVDAKQYEDTLSRFNLSFEKINQPLLNEESIESVYKVKESLVDIVKLKSNVKEKLGNSKIKIFFSNQVSADELKSKYDFIIVSAYAGINSALGRNIKHDIYQYEICEKPVIELPLEFKNVSIVVMDGPFTCIDPLRDTGLHVMGNVVHAIHSTNTGDLPEIPRKIRGLLNSGIIKNPEVTNFNLFMETANYFMPKTKNAKHIGSMFTIRTVLPFVDSTDTRPTLVRRIDDQVISIFSGKLSNCVKAAEDTLAIIEGE